MKNKIKPIYADFTGLPEPTYPNFKFTAENAGFKSARVGKLTCPHGTIETPNFIFCGTRATVKGLNSEQLREAETDIILANTYHLMIRPGEDTIAEAGGLHKFMRWNGPMLTDSGGYQVFAMGFGSVSEEIKGKRAKGQNTILKIEETGVRFKSYKDGQMIDLTPERSIEIQRKLGADFIVQFDECTPYHATREYTEQSTHLSIRWGDRSLAEFIRTDTGKQAIYAVVQGGVYPDFRQVSAEHITSRPFFGTAIGGCLGQTSEEMRRVVSQCMPYLPKERPVHLLGIGLVEDLLFGVLEGIDTFDCVSPTRVARHGHALVEGIPGNKINLKNAIYKNDHSPLMSEGPLEIHQYSKAYIHHLFNSGEMLGSQILTINNVYIMNKLMRDIRNGLRQEKFPEVFQQWTGKPFPTQ